MEYAISDLKSLILKALTKAGIPLDQATIIMEHAVGAQLSGKPSHGVKMIMGIIDNYKKAHPSKITVIKDTPVSSLLDGGELPGIYVATQAMERAIDKAKITGIGIVGGYNTGGIGILAMYMRQAINNDLIGMSTCSSTGTVVPYGSASSILGTNPIAIGIPSDPLPIILDMATSSITFSEVKAAIDKGVPVKPNSVVDENGRPTTDPKMVFKGGLLPFDRSYKGYGLGLIAEILGGPLVNAKAGWNAVKGSWGFIMVAMNPEILVSLDKFKSDVQSLVNEIKNAKIAEGFDEIFIPGEKSFRNMKRCMDSGKVLVDDQIINAVENLT
jgi:L-2-hydroxycarboxylate dehydrogenase (NAD+)